MRALRITFILPMAGLAGGVKVMYEYANLLARQGHEVKIVYPRHLFPPRSSAAWRLEASLRQAKYKIDAARGISEANWFPLEVPLLRTPSLEARYIPDADIVVATANETADWVARLPGRCGSKFYFIQGYELWSRDKATVEATYRLPLKKIVISNYLRRIVEATGASVFRQVPNAIDTDVFYPEPSDLKVRHGVLALYHPEPLKGVADARRAINLVRKARPETSFTLFGATQPAETIVEANDFQLLPDQTKLRQLYSNAAVFLAPSLYEGWGLTPMEAMACGCAVVATNVGGIPEYSTDGKTALIVEPGDTEAMAKCILRLLNDPKLREVIAEAGYQRIQQFSLACSAEALEAAFRDGLKRS